MLMRKLRIRNGNMYPNTSKADHYAYAGAAPYSVMQSGRHNSTIGSKVYI